MGARNKIPNGRPVPMENSAGSISKPVFRLLQPGNFSLNAADALQAVRDYTPFPVRLGGIGSARQARCLDTRRMPAWIRGTEKG